MAKWKDALAKSGLKAEKLNKKTRQEITEFEQLEGIRADAEAALAEVTDDPTKSAEIAGDIEDMGKKMQKLDDKICVGITHSADIKEQQRERAAVSFGKTAKAKPAVAAQGAVTQAAAPAQAASPAPAQEPVQTTQAAAEPAQTTGAVETEEEKERKKKEKEKDGGFGIIETAASIAFAGICVWLGIAYHNDSFPFGNKNKR